MCAYTCGVSRSPGRPRSWPVSHSPGHPRSWPVPHRGWKTLLVLSVRTICRNGSSSLPRQFARYARLHGCGERWYIRLSIALVVTKIRILLNDSPVLQVEYLSQSPFVWVAVDGQKCVCVLLQCDLVARPSSFIPLLLRAKSKQYDFFLATWHFLFKMTKNVMRW